MIASTTKENFNQWLLQKNHLPGTLAIGLIHPDKSTSAQGFSPDFSDMVFARILTHLVDTLQKYQQQKLPGSRLGWTFELFLLHAALRHEGTCLVALTPKNVSPDDLAQVDNLFREFQSL